MEKGQNSWTMRLVGVALLALPMLFLVLISRASGAQTATQPLANVPCDAGASLDLVGCQPPVSATPTNTLASHHVANGKPDPHDPACSDHNERSWHGLHNPTEDCHYSHAHGQPEPAWISELFGGEWASALYTISYSWQTPDENRLKHEGYITQAWDLRPYACHGVEAYAVQFHGVGIGHGKMARFHSFYGAAQLCNGNGFAGQILTGGHADFGQLISPYKKNFVAYPRFPVQLYDIGLPPYVGEADPQSDSQKETWNSETRSEYSEAHTDAHQLFNHAFRIRRAVDFVDPATRDSGHPVFVPFVSPDSNSSAYQLYAVTVSIPDLNGDGSRVSFAGYTDVHGVIDDNCTASGSKCVPLVIRDAVPGTYKVNITAELAGELGIDTNSAHSYYDHDITFNGQPSGWIDLSGFGEE